MHIATKQCPVLLRSNLHELFPAPEVYNKGPLTMVTLTSRQLDCVLSESGAKTVCVCWVICIVIDVDSVYFTN